MGIWVEVSEWKKVQLKGGGFVDDKAPIGLMSELKNWYMQSSLFCLFHDAEPNPPKCGVHMKDYVQGSDRLLKAVLSVRATCDGGCKARGSNEAEDGGG